MKIKLILIFGLIILGFTNCQKDDLFASSQETILGNWKYDKVTFLKEGSFKSVNISSNYSHIKFEFFEDNTFIQTNTQINQSAIGEWYIGTDTVTTEDSYSVIEYLEGSLLDTATNVSTEVFWDYLEVKRTKIKYQEEKDGGKYTYKLVRILDGRRNNTY